MAFDFVRRYLNIVACICERCANCRAAPIASWTTSASDAATSIALRAKRRRADAAADKRPGGSTPAVAAPGKNLLHLVLREPHPEAPSR